MATGTINSQYGTPTQLWTQQGSTTYDLTLNEIPQYKMLGFHYAGASLFGMISLDILRHVPSFALYGKNNNNTDVQMTVTYVSDTQLTINTTNGSRVRIYGIK